MTHTTLDFQAIIVGAGPAGSAAAIHLANRAPELASRILLIDKATFPRPKLCGGGVTRRAEEFLRELNVEIDVLSVPIHAARLILKDGAPLKNRQEQFRVVAREEFDERLFRCAQARGVQTSEGESIVDIAYEADCVRVTTNKSTYTAAVIVGADGANSRVRRLLGLKRASVPPVVFEILVPVDPDNTMEFTQNTALMDFKPVAAANGAGYCWSFPSIRHGMPMLNLGAAFFNPRLDVAQGEETKRIFRQWLCERGLNLDDFELKGHPMPLFHPATPCSAPRAVLVGDAAGVEPLMGEGISSALGFGIVAAETILDAIRRQDFSLTEYKKRLHKSKTGLLLRSRRVWARSFYRDPSYSQIARMSHLALSRKTPEVAA